MPLSAQAPLRILFVGNSYTFVNDLPGTFTRLAAAGKPAVRVETQSIAIGGARLRDHINNAQVFRTLTASHWDYVVLQEQSHLGVDDLNAVEPFQSAARELDTAIRKSGAKTAFFLTWSRKSAPQEQEQLDDAYNSIARRLGATVIPVGPAWMQVRKERPALELYQGDGSHPSLAGTYLAACTFYAVLLGRTPVGLAGAVHDTLYLQETAWRVSGKSSLKSK